MVLVLVWPSGFWNPMWFCWMLQMCIMSKDVQLLHPIWMNTESQILDFGTYINLVLRTLKMHLLLCRRGNPLQLNEEIYKELRQVWFQHHIPQRIRAEMEKNPGLMRIKWDHM